MSVISRAAAAAAVLALGLSLTAPSADARTASPGRATPTPATLGATWLAHQLQHGVIHNDQFKSDDYGLTADTVLALEQIGGRSDAVRAAKRALAQHVDSYTTGKDFGSDDVYAGSVAKLLVVAQHTGAKAHHFGGVDLVRRLAGLVTTTGPATGRIHDDAETDYANVIGQVFAARGLVQAGNGKAGDALDFLLQQQCRAGYFRQAFAADPTAAKQSCDAAPAKQSRPATDVTALAVIELAPLAQKRPAVARAVAHATHWLGRHQGRDGSFGTLGAPTKAAPANTNSTGLAAWALGQSGSCRKAGRAAGWVESLQLEGDIVGTPLAREEGAVAYDATALKTGSKDGITKKTRDQWRRATSQAAPGLLYVDGGRCH